MSQSDKCPTCGSPAETNPFCPFCSGDKHPTKHPIAQAVEAHALAHYEEGGWDVIYETYEESEILSELEEAELDPDDHSPENMAKAIAHFGWVAGIQSERRASQSFWG